MSADKALETIEKNESKADSLNKIIETINFETKAKYGLHVRGGRYGIVCYVERKLNDSRTGQPMVVNNSFRVETDITDDNFIKALFRSIGQFECHEFMESFTVSGKHAYFPHEHEDKNFALYAQGNHVNKMLLGVFRDVEKGNTPFQIAIRYLGIWFTTLTVYKTTVKGLEVLDRYAELFTDKLDLLEAKVRHSWRVFKNVAKREVNSAKFVPTTIKVFSYKNETVSWIVVRKPKE